MALLRRKVELGLTHQSDCGSQQTSCDYADLRKQNRNGIAISMARKGER